MKILIAIDDTDNAESRGTGFRARELGSQLGNLEKTIYCDVTRHQLLFDPRIPYTSHNSSACICIESELDIDFLRKICEAYLIENSAEGSDAGLCIVPFDSVSEENQVWGERAKKEILNMDEARKIAAKHSVFLEGYTGTKGGIIGSLAAVGLRRRGEDGRFLYVKGMRELKGSFSIEVLLKNADIDCIVELSSGKEISSGSIWLEEWWRPVLKGSKKVLYVESSNNIEYEWTNITKDVIRSISS
ncbi:MAG: hypothetical protein WCK02_07490 [Bacteroidota bacterium]